MSWLENINISLAMNPLYFFFGFIIIVLYTFFIYKTTLPPVRKIIKFFLILFRILALTIILLLIFDPVLTLTSSTKVVPQNLVFVDNSKSIKEFNSNTNLKKINQLILKLESKLEGKTQFFTFGRNINEYNIGKDTLKFDQSSTRFNEIIKQIKKADNVASVVIVSDGINNEGKNPTHAVTALGIPIYTIGIGDTTSDLDISVERIISNKFIYTNRETEIEVTINNKKLSGKKAIVQVFENQKLISKERILLSPTGMNRIKFPYKSSSKGNQNLKVIASIDIKENNLANNEKSTIIKILETKKKIVIIAGSPSSDLSIIMHSIKENEEYEEYEVEQLIQINSNEFYKNKNNLDSLEHADILFLVDFPTKTSNPKYIIEIANKISEYNIPIFFSLGYNLDYSKLSSLKKIIPFKYSNISNKFGDNQIISNNNESELLGRHTSWGELPPISISRTKIIPFPTSKILLFTNLNKTPVLFTNNLGNSKSIVLNASNIWRWKLKSSNKGSTLFDNFILNSIKWLSVKSENKYFSVRTLKNSYKLGESIVFNTNLYDETLEPQNNANIIIELNNGFSLQQFNFTSIGNGIYESLVNLSKPGKYNYSVKLVDSNRNLPPINGSIIIETVELELVDNKLNKNFLQTISNNTKGKYYGIDKTNDLPNKLNSYVKNKIYYKFTDNELRLSNFGFILFFLVLLFTTEWLTRKAQRMI